MTGSSADRSFMTHLQCSACGCIADHRVLQTVCPSCGKTLLARYDLSLASKVLTRDPSGNAPHTMWRHRKLLPLIDDTNKVSLGEGCTPVFPLHRLGRSLDLKELHIKDESANPTGSFKARGLSMAVSRAKELGVTEVCVPTAGNAGSALAAYGAAAGMRVHVYVPADTPALQIDECRTYGADVHLVAGTISDAARAMNEERTGQEWFDVSTLKEPYRLEGKKTLGYEIAEQFDWDLPEVIVYPTGGGTGLIGMWKSFEEMGQLGWIGVQRPKMVCVQSTGCAPLVRAFENGSGSSEFWENASTLASGLRVPRAFADALILGVLRESGGTAVAVDDENIVSAIRAVASTEGILLSPEGAATVAALPLLKTAGIVQQNTRVLILNTATGLKYPEVLRMAAANTRIDWKQTVAYIDNGHHSFKQS